MSPLFPQTFSLRSSPSSGLSNTRVCPEQILVEFERLHGQWGKDIVIDIVGCPVTRKWVTVWSADSGAFVTISYSFNLSPVRTKEKLL